jgi:hypothetical protein
MCQNPGTSSAFRHEIDTIDRIQAFKLKMPCPELIERLKVHRKS